MRQAKRLSVVGLGLINCLGIGRTRFWERLLDRACGIAPVEGMDVQGDRIHLGGQIRGFDPKAFMPPRFYRRLSRLSRLSVAASIEALRDAAIPLDDANRHRVGCVYGTAFGSTDQTDGFYLSLLDHGPEGAEPFLFPDTVPNALASHVAIFHQIQGPNSTVCQNHLSGECALAYAHSLLASGQADVLAVGGADELSPILFHSLAAIRAIRSPSATSSAGNGPGELASGTRFIPGEAASCLVIQRDGDPALRPARTYGTIDGLAVVGARTAQGHYERDGEALTHAMLSALDEAGLDPDAIDLIGSPINGVAELETAEIAAIETVFGKRSLEIPRFPLRRFTGEFGSAGLLAVATLLLALSEQKVPPHFTGPGRPGNSRSSSDLVAPKSARLRHAMAIGATFGGGAGCMVLSAPRVD